MLRKNDLLNWLLTGSPRIIRCRRKTSLADKLKYQKYKTEARILVGQKLEKYNQVYNFKYNRVSIKNQRSRWGSCSRLGNLNFNYRLASLPAELADYIIVHELCHLKEMNHSARFWQLVAQTMPDYLERRQGLRKIRIN